MTLAAAPPPRDADIAWVAEGGFREPETVLLLPDDTLLVSNVCDFTVTGNGFLTLLDGKGNTVDWRVVDGLDAPLGMALVSDRLWCVDLSKNAVIIIGPEWLSDIDVLGGEGVISADHGYAPQLGLALIPTGFENTVIAIRLGPPATGTGK